ncbi:MAG: aminodeoxychorismate lyase [Gammaproteobacteria bacterium]|nr:MAG: aminodeoxychorismate lyase [Gammaproteobacteria bacterium]
MYRLLIRSLMIAGLLVAVAGIFLFFDYQRFLKTPITTDNSSETFTVQSGDTVAQLIKKFPASGILLAQRSPLADMLGPYYFRHLAGSSGKDSQIKVGEYRLEAGMKPIDFLNALVSGKTITYKITFLEGWTFKQMRKHLKENPHIEQTLTYVPDKEIMSALGFQSMSCEGQFFPDTYRFSNHTKDSEILTRAHQQMRKNLDKAWQSRSDKTQLKSPYEMLILASIIEKETGIDTERRQVSGVFHRRLKKGMYLQTDPTVAYGMGDKYKGRIYRSDLRRDTPYNTYTRKGLPPTPIAMPGMASLLAAGQPDSGESLYFVADGKGGHAFSNTYKEHRKAVKAYRQLKNQAEQAGQDEEDD